MSDERLRRCEKVLGVCDAAFNDCNINLETLESALNSCEAVVSKQDELIAADKERIEVLVVGAGHSHVPVVAGTSAFWLILLLLL